MMKTSHQILKMSERDLRRLVARQQVEKAETDADWARGYVPPQEWPVWDEALTDAKRVKREVYAATKLRKTCVTCRYFRQHTCASPENKHDGQTCIGKSGRAVIFTTTDPRKERPAWCPGFQAKDPT